VGGVCYRKGYEKGLWFEIKCIKQDIASKTQRSVDCHFERGILKAYEKLTEKDYAERDSVNRVKLGD